MTKKELRVIVSIDVEEEGLFSGRYARIPEGVSNVSCLKQLHFITREFGIPLSLLVDYPVAQDLDSRDILLTLHHDYQAEIGAHLHHWNTPPFVDLPHPDPVPSDLLGEDLLKNKMETLLEAIETGLSVSARSFRMGRFDFGHCIESVLPRVGIETDSSIVPMRYVPGGPDRFLAPADPYFISVDSSAQNGPHKLFEVPLTMAPIFPGSDKAAYASAKVLPRFLREAVLSKFRLFGALGIQPVWHPLLTMLRAVKTHVARGGRVLTMFFHSSELMPGCSPNFPDQTAVDRLLRKIRIFLEKVSDSFHVVGTTFTRLNHEYNGLSA